MTLLSVECTNVTRKEASGSSERGNCGIFYALGRHRLVLCVEGGGALELAKVLLNRDESTRSLTNVDCSLARD